LVELGADPDGPLNSSSNRVVVVEAELEAGLDAEPEAETKRKDDFATDAPAPATSKPTKTTAHNGAHLPHLFINSPFSAAVARESD
jgi:hypothetical protein